MAKYSIIGSFFDIRKTKFYKIFNPKKYKYAMKDEKYTYKNGPIRGHRALALSLFRGFQKLGIEYDYNEIKSDCENVILLWTDKKELKIVGKLKKRGKIKKVVTVPTACKYDYDYMMWHFPEIDYIDCALYASDDVVKTAREKADEKYWHKIKAWPSGVELPIENNEKKNTNSCILYSKKISTPLSLFEEVKKMLDEIKIDYHVLEYGNYDFNNWQELLKKVDFVIFYQDCQETQGLAMDEAWANDLPAIVKMTKTSDGEFNYSCPYLTEQNGLNFKNNSELREILLKYKENPIEFLNNFSPRKYIEENMSDETSVKNLIQIFDEIKN